MGNGTKRTGHGRLAVWRLVLWPTFVYMLIFNGWLILMGHIAQDYLKKVDFVWLGIFGVILVLATLIYSLRKRLVFSSGRLKFWLEGHVYGASAGAFMALLHSELQFNSLVPVLTFIIMEAVVLTGALARFAFAETSRSTAGKNHETHRSRFGSNDRSNLDDETALTLLSIENMQHWRTAHIYASSILLSLLLLHILSEFYYRGLNL